jgi:hypothetical protein
MALTIATALVPITFLAIKPGRPIVDGGHGTIGLGAQLREGTIRGALGTAFVNNWHTVTFVGTNY